MIVINIYQTSPNQKCVMTHKTLSDETHLYGKCNIEATLLAAKTLSDRAYKLYTRMNLHQDQYGYALSPTEIRGSIGMSEKRYQQAVRELIEKGYLIRRKNRSNLYDFYEWPGDAADPDGLEYDGAVSEPEGTPDKMDSAPVRADMAGAESAGDPGGIGGVRQPGALGTPPASEGEILQDTTFNKTTNTTTNTITDTTTNTTTHLMPYSARRMEYIQKKEESYRKCRELQARIRKELEEKEKKEQIEQKNQENPDMAEEIDEKNAELGDTWSWDDDNLPF